MPLFDDGYEAVAGVRTFQEGESRLRRIVGLGFLIFAHLFVFGKAVVDSQRMLGRASGKGSASSGRSNRCPQRA